MAQRIDKLKEELAALDRAVIEDSGASRRIHKAIPIVGAFVALVGFSSVTWYAYNQGILEGSEEAAPYLKPKGPLKTTPVKPGGARVPFQGTHVYGTIEGRENDTRPIKMFPPPAKPRELPNALSPGEREPALSAHSEQRDIHAESKKPQVAKPRTAVETLETARKLSAQNAPPPLPPPTKLGDIRPAPGVGAKATKQTMLSNEPIRLIPGPKRNAQKTIPVAPPATVEPKLKRKAKTKAPAKRPSSIFIKPPKISKLHVQKKKTQPSRSVRGKGYYIQLGALRSQSAAKRAWNLAQKMNLRLLRNRSLSVQRATVPKKGVFYRVQSGPFADRREAKNLCEALKRRKQGCFVVRRR